MVKAYKASGGRQQASGIGHRAAGIRDQESGTRNQESGIRNQESGIRNLGPGSGIWNQESGIRNLENEMAENYFSIFSNEATIPLISEELKPLCSISFNPTMVHPFGVVTLSISNSGC